MTWSVMMEALTSCHTGASSSAEPMLPLSLRGGAALLWLMVWLLMLVSRAATRRSTLGGGAGPEGLKAPGLKRPCAKLDIGEGMPAVVAGCSEPA